MGSIVTNRTPFTLISTIPSCIAIKSGKIKVAKNKMKISQQCVALESDIEDTLRSQCYSVPYTNLAYIGGFLKFDEIKEIKLSKNTKVNGEPVVLEGSVTATFSVIKLKEAKNPADGSPDPTPFYTFTFKLTPRPRKASSR